jgi:hypothetical protein
MIKMLKARLHYRPKARSYFAACQLLVRRSRDPECDVVRALLALTIVDIEKAARLR